MGGGRGIYPLPWWERERERGNLKCLQNHGTNL